MLEERAAELLALAGRPSPGCTELLRLAAHLGPEPIPLTLFTTYPDRLPNPFAAVVRDPLAFASLIRLLRQRGLARVEPGSLQLHRLVQAILRCSTRPTSLVTSPNLRHVHYGYLMATLGQVDTLSVCHGGNVGKQTPRMIVFLG